MKTRKVTKGAVDMMQFSGTPFALILTSRHPDYVGPAYVDKSRKYTLLLLPSGIGIVSNVSRTEAEDIIRELLKFGGVIAWERFGNNPKAFTKLSDREQAMLEHVAKNPGVTMERAFEYVRQVEIEKARGNM